MRKFKVSDYTLQPGPGKIIHGGNDSGEYFYKTYIKDLFEKCVKNKEKLFFDLDGTVGYAWSFNKDIFVSLTEDFGKENVFKYLILKSDEEPYLIPEIIDCFILGKEQKDVTYY